MHQLLIVIMSIVLTATAVSITLVYNPVSLFVEIKLRDKIVEDMQTLQNTWDRHLQHQTEERWICDRLTTTVRTYEECRRIETPSLAMDPSSDWIGELRRQGQVPTPFVRNAAWVFGENDIGVYVCSEFKNSGPTGAAALSGQRQFEFNKLVLNIDGCGEKNSNFDQDAHVDQTVYMTYWLYHRDEYHAYLESLSSTTESTDNNIPPAGGNPAPEPPPEQPPAIPPPEEGWVLEDVAQLSLITTEQEESVVEGVYSMSMAQMGTDSYGFNFQIPEGGTARLDLLLTSQHNMNYPSGASIELHQFINGTPYVVDDNGDAYLNITRLGGKEVSVGSSALSPGNYRLIAKTLRGNSRGHEVFVAGKIYQHVITEIVSTQAVGNVMQGQSQSGVIRYLIDEDGGRFQISPNGVDFQSGGPQVVNGEYGYIVFQPNGSYEYRLFDGVVSPLPSRLDLFYFRLVSNTEISNTAILRFSEGVN